MLPPTTLAPQVPLVVKFQQGSSATALVAPQLSPDEPTQPPDAAWMSVMRPSPFAHFNPRAADDEPSFVQSSNAGNVNIDMTLDENMDTTMFTTIADLAKEQEEKKGINDLEMACIDYSPKKLDN